MFGFSFKRRYNVLVIGGNGMLGHDLVNRLKFEATSERGSVNMIDYPDSSKLDASDLFTLEFYLKHRVKFDYVINCAAYTDTVGCENESKRAESFRLNSIIPRNLAIVCKKYNMKLIHVSTNEVFRDGIHNRVESEPCSPTTVYGMEKYIAELEISKILPTRKYAIVRTSWLFGTHGGKSFVHKCVAAFIKHYKFGTELFGIDDEMGVPTSTWTFSDVLVNVMNNGIHGIIHARQYGISVSRYSYMKRILEEFHRISLFTDIDADKDIKIAMTKDMPNIRYVGNIVLSSEFPNHWKIVYGWVTREWQESLREMIEDYGMDIYKSIKNKIDNDESFKREHKNGNRD